MSFRPAALPWLRFLYVGAACILCACSVGPMSFVEAGGIPAAVMLLAIMPWYWREAFGVFRHGVVWALVAWGAWGLVSLAWSPNVDNGLWELSSMRYGWFLIVLAPALRYRRHLVLALALGFVGAVMAQGVLAVIRAQGWTELDYAAAYKDRNPGWWVHPAVCAYMLVPALGLHAPAAAGRGPGAWIARAAMVLMWAGILASGTRGAMLGGAAMTALTLGAAVWVRLRGAPAPRRGRVILAGVVVLLVAYVAVGTVAASDTHSGRRIREGVREVRRALVERDVSTFTGARMQFVVWAAEQFMARPLRGVGAGGYQTTIRETYAARGEKVPTPSIPSQAHNTYAHAAATLGVPGLLLALGITALALRGGFAGAEGRSLTYDAGPAWALVGFVLVTPFDVVYVNSPPSALLAVLLALCLPGRPRVAPLGAYGPDQSPPPRDFGPCLPATRSM